MRYKLPIAENQVIKRLAGYVKRAPEGLAVIPTHDIVRLVRQKLRMTQAQLAKRVGMPQSHIAKMERGRVDIQMSTLKKIFEAMFCDLLILPRPRLNLDLIIAERIRKTAQKKVERLMGTMALEKQRPGDAAIKDLIKAEELQLAGDFTSEIWDE